MLAQLLETRMHFRADGAGLRARPRLLGPKTRLRMGLGLSHISNASLGDRNPGVEVLSFGFSFPLGR